jgi:hypothetical protein
MPSVHRSANVFYRLSTSAAALVVLSFALISGSTAAEHVAPAETRQGPAPVSSIQEGPLTFPASEGDAILLTSDGRQLHLGGDRSNVQLPFLHPGRYELRITASARPTRTNITFFDIEIPSMGAPTISRRESSRSSMPSAIFGFAAVVSAALLAHRRRQKSLTIASALLVVLAGPVRIIDATPTIEGFTFAGVCALFIAWLWRAERYRRFTPIAALIFPPLIAPALVFAPIVAAFSLPKLLPARRAVIALAGLSTVSLLFVVVASLQPSLPPLPKAAAAVAQLSDCSSVENPTDRTNCSVDFFMSRLDGGVALDDVLAELFDSQYDTMFITRGLANCHGVGHYLGQRLYDVGVMPGQLGGFAQVCGSGLLHGLAEQAGVSADDLEFAAIAKSCELSNPGHAKACSHGVGHGAYVRAGGDLASAIMHCEDVQVIDGGECVAGAFMIYADAWTSFARFGTWPAHIKPFPIVAAPLDACASAQLKRYTDTCIRSMLEVYRNYNLENVNPEIPNIDQAVEWCAQHPRDRTSCADGLGSAVNGYLAEPDPVKVSEVCSSTDVQRCMRAFAKVYALMSTLRGEIPSDAFCDSLTSGLSLCRDEIDRVNSTNFRFLPAGSRP